MTSACSNTALGELYSWLRAQAQLPYAQPQEWQFGQLSGMLMAVSRGAYGHE